MVSRVKELSNLFFDMRILMIATGYPPYLFSENLCNGKLALALLQNGIQIDAVSRIDDGPSYSAEWIAPWDTLKPTANIIEYTSGNKLQQIADVVYSGCKMGWNFSPGIRWARRAYEKGRELIKQHRYDAVITRSPNDIAHLVGYMLKKKTGCRWIANWNDPAAPIWPGQYKQDFSSARQKKELEHTAMLLSSVDVNTFPSDSLRQHFIENFPFLRNRATGILPHIGLIDSAWPKGEQKSDEMKIRFLHSGNLSSERNPETTFQAMRRLIDDGFDKFEFHIMGVINDYTIQLINKYNLDGYVKFIGSFPYIKALSKMQSYDVMVLLEAKLDKGIFFASKFTDYLQTGLPILAISPKTGFAINKLSGKKGEYTAYNQDVDDIYRAIKQVLLDFNKNRHPDNDSRELYNDVSPKTVVNTLVDIIRR